MKIAIGNDHAATDYKNEIVKFLEKEGHEVINLGTDSHESVDYPVFAKKVCNVVVKKEADFGILLCGTGIGVSIAANKVEGIRAALLYNEYSARLTKQHNNANVIAFGARVMGIDLILSCIKAYMESEYEGGRHQRRIDMLESCGC
ncbi:ribose 5-phosphate isomerase B [Sneathia vaginalis]|jgi:ribose-5-phosphate isomerase B|uniref:ribose 5-phosphate isomerase B n=1 Tax=Sneathia TaxID=168808 RepID=UPI0018693861|nr:MULTISPECIES: ribose 5-phosphate isomerase B [Sneathia]MBE2989895.1 ribose 5-phosphate isomerase B [Sneathia sp. DSM 16630]MBE3031401.1 ribose 5-phosphate isomerase B [Sneathia sp. DSM 16631]MDK9582030.1 ribose 5-phosphate isomerase B [Sneathia vaginalis]